MDVEASAPAAAPPQAAQLRMSDTAAATPTSVAAAPAAPIAAAQSRSSDEEAATPEPPSAPAAAAKAGPAGKAAPESATPAAADVSPQAMKARVPAAAQPSPPSWRPRPRQAEARPNRRPRRRRYRRGTPASATTTMAESDVPLLELQIVAAVCFLALGAATVWRARRRRRRSLVGGTVPQPDHSWEVYRNHSEIRIGGNEMNSDRQDSSIGTRLDRGRDPRLPRLGRRSARAIGQHGGRRLHEPGHGHPGAGPAAPAAQSAASPTGIWVAGEGTIDLEPDLALLNVGVEVQAETVSEARSEAAAAMDAVIAAVKASRPHRRRHPDLLVQHLAAVRLRRGRSDPGRLPRLQHGDDQDA